MSILHNGCWDITFLVLIFVDSFHFFILSFPFGKWVRFRRNINISYCRTFLLATGNWDVLAKALIVRLIKRRISGRRQQRITTIANKNSPRTVPIILRSPFHDSLFTQSHHPFWWVFQLEFLVCSSLNSLIVSIIFVKFPSSPLCSGIMVQHSSPISSQSPWSGAIIASIIYLFCRAITDVACNCSLTSPNAVMV